MGYLLGREQIGSATPNRNFSDMSLTPIMPVIQSEAALRLTVPAYESHVRQ